MIQRAQVDKNIAVLTLDVLDDLIGFIPIGANLTHYQAALRVHDSDLQDTEAVIAVLTRVDQVQNLLNQINQITEANLSAIRLAVR